MPDRLAPRPPRTIAQGGHCTERQQRPVVTQLHFVKREDLTVRTTESVGKGNREPVLEPVLKGYHPELAKQITDSLVRVNRQYRIVPFPDHAHLFLYWSRRRPRAPVDGQVLLFHYNTFYAYSQLRLSCSFETCYDNRSTNWSHYDHIKTRVHYPHRPFPHGFWQNDRHQRSII